MRAFQNHFIFFVFGTCLAFGALSRANAQLNVTYGPSGVQTLAYAGVTLEDLSASPNDVFHIWHMKLTDMTGTVLTGPSYGWGENNTGKSWDLKTKTWTYHFAWGTIAVQFSQVGMSLNMLVTETNLTGSGVILDGASIYPLVLNFPHLPLGFMDASYPQLAFNTTAPSVTAADFGSGEVMAVVPSAEGPLYSGFMPAGASNSYTPIISSTAPDSLATFQPYNDRPVQPGQTASFTVSLRFASSGTLPGALAADAYRSWEMAWPAQLKWTDRRPIGTVYLASSPSGASVSQSGGYPNNPRRYFNDSNANDFDITTASGLAAFQARLLLQAQTSVSNMQRLGAQGAITWDIEGEQFPQNTSYACEPDLIASIAPEMETLISDRSSSYFGMKLDDAYFRIMTSAGFRVGVCVRPQHFTLNSDGTAHQVYLPDSAIVTELTRKIKYAHDRWGATLFYLDSTVEPDGGTLDAGLFQQVAARFPDSLLIPEETTPKAYAYTAPFLSYIFHGTLGTDATVRNYYPAAISAILVNDADASTLAKNTSALIASVKAGDILMAHVDYWQANNPVIVAIYGSAGVTAPPALVPVPIVPPVAVTIPVPTPTIPVVPVMPSPMASTSALITILSPSDGDIVSGPIAVNGLLSTNLDAAGSYLMVDGQEIGSSRVTKAPYLYPLDTTLLPPGSHKLQIWAHDQNNEVLLSSVTSIMVASIPPGSSPITAAPPTPGPIAPGTSSPVTAAPITTQPVSLAKIVYPQAGQSISGLIQVSAVIGVQLDAAGSYLMIDGQESGLTRLTSPPYLFPLDTTRLCRGIHQLQVWAHDTNNDTIVSSPVNISTLP